MKDDAAALNQGDSKTLGKNALADKAVERCIRIIEHVNRFKQPRIDKIQLYRDLYAGKVKKKFRQPFNVVLPVFAGLFDTLQAQFNDDLSLEFKEQEPSDYLPVRKLNTLWTMETASVAPNAKFAMKARQDRANALYSGRGHMMNYAVSDPDYKNVFEIFEFEDAIFQPSGGGHLENHLYAGRDNITRSEADLKNYSVYDKAQVTELVALAAKTDFDPLFQGQDARKLLGKFKAMGLSPENADYVGDPLFKLVEMAITMDGIRYHLVFSPWYKKWVRFDKLEAVFSADLYPWVSWATHEDNRNFASKSYGDDVYGVADAIHTLFNQELTAREKSNYHARAYDKEMFPDVGKLDAAQHRPDALVPVDTKGGTRKIAEGIYSFDTGQLTGTINLIEWIRGETGKDIGVTDLMMGAANGITKRASVILAEQQAIAKRILLRSSSYTEAMSEIGKLFFLGCKDHLPAKKAIRLLGADGAGWDEITRADLEIDSDPDVRIVSSAIDIHNSQLKKEGRLKTLELIVGNPQLVPNYNSRWLGEELLRVGGEYDDPEIKIALDTKNYASKEEVARAHMAIKAVLEGDKPQIYYGATTLFMQVIHDFAIDSRTDIGDDKYHQLLEFEMAHAQLAAQNMARTAQMSAALAPGGGPADPSMTGPGGPTPPGAPATPPTGATPAGASPAPVPSATTTMMQSINPRR